MAQAQTFLNSPSPDALAVESVLFAATLASFLATNLYPASYERWHAAGLHVVPGAWSTAVACTHASLLPALPWL